MEAFVRQLAVLSVLWALTELLLPEGRQQKMARMTVSALVMAALVSGIGGLLSLPAESGLPDAAAATAAAGRQSYARAALSAAANQAEAYCVHLARRAGWEARAAVYLTAEGAVDHIDLRLESGEAPLTDGETLRQTIAGQLGIAPDRIRLTVSEADAP